MNRPRGFTMVELLVVLALVALAAGMASFALRDPAAARLDQEALRLAALLESARAQSRATGTLVRFELASAEGSDATPFRFTGLQRAEDAASGWLDADTRAEIIGARVVVLGPEPMIGAQRIVLRLGDRRVTLATDGLDPFAPLTLPEGGAAR